MPVKLVDTGLNLTLGAGKTKKLWWNNANPSKAVWSVNAVPLPKNAKSSHSGSVEVTRVWRKLNVSVPSRGAPQAEHEIHYEVFNPGTSSVNFTVYMLVGW